MTDKTVFETQEDLLVLLISSPFALITVLIPVFSIPVVLAGGLVVVDLIAVLSTVRYALHRAKGFTHHEAARTMRRDMTEFVTEPCTGFQEREDRDR